MEMQKETRRENVEMKVVTVIARVQKMERYFDKVSNALHIYPATMSEDSDIQKMIQQLAEYMDSGQWLQDFECDSRGELPKDLKRGVLSEDGLYNLLCEVGW